MPRPVPYLFCRYQMQVEDELLNAVGQLGALQSIKGQLFPHGPKAAREQIHDILVMRPAAKTVSGEEIITWSVGHRPGVRRRTEYDTASDSLTSALESDTHTVYTDIIAIPRLGVMAVDDRVSSEYMGALPALSRLRSAFTNVEEGAFQFSLLAAGDVDAMLNDLDLTEYSYSVRRFNPHSPSALAKRTSDAMEAEGIGILRGTAKPMPGESMEAGEGLIQGTSDLAEAGYGVRGFKGTTESGHLVQVPKPSFDLDKTKNLKAREKPQRLRVFFERLTEEDDLCASVVNELVRFYGGNVTPAVPAQPA